MTEKITTKLKLNRENKIANIKLLWEFIKKDYNNPENEVKSILPSDLKEMVDLYFNTFPENIENFIFTSSFVLKGLEYSKLPRSCDEFQELCGYLHTLISSLSEGEEVLEIILDYTENLPILQGWVVIRVGEGDYTTNRIELDTQQDLVLFDGFFGHDVIEAYKLLLNKGYEVDRIVESSAF